MRNGFQWAVFSLMLSLPCNAENNTDVNAELINSLVKKYVSENAIVDLKKPLNILQGDFNGDGINDFAVVFLPVTGVVETNRLKVTKLWNYPESVANVKLHKSLIIFHGSKGGWLSDETKVFVFLDQTGVLEAPSFKLLISRVKDKDYKNNISYLPVVIQSDLIILPSEAGIDTYIYWDKGVYILYEPDEIP